MTKKKNRHQKKSSQDQGGDSVEETTTEPTTEPTLEKEETTVEETVVEETVVEETVVEETVVEETVVEKEETTVEEAVIEETIIEKEEPKEEPTIKKDDDDNMWNNDENEIDVPTVEGGDNDIDTTEAEVIVEKEEKEEEEPKKYIIKQKKLIKVKKEKKVRPPKIVAPVEPAPVVQQSAGWGGWFSSIGNAVTNTITQIARVDLDDSEDEESEEEILVEEDIELTKEEYEKYMQEKIKRNLSSVTDSDDDDGILNVIDNGVFKTADIIADSLYFAGNFLSSGFKSVQDNASIDNVKGITQEVSSMSLDTKNKLANSELYGKSQKLATQMMDSSVDALESVGQKAYSMFSSQMKLKSPSSPNESDNINSNNNYNETNTNSPSPSSISPTSPKSPSNKTTTNTNTDTSDNEFNINESIFEAGEFDSSKCAEHFNITKFTQDIEKVSVESTMKAHQINRKVIAVSGIKSSVDAVLNEIRDLFESEELPETTLNSNTLSFSNIQIFEVEKKYREFFDKLQEYTPQLKNQSIELGLCRGLEKIYQLSSIGLELISNIANCIPDEKAPQELKLDNELIKEWALSKSNEILFTITKISQDIKSISSILNEIIKSKQSNPNSRKLINTLHIETTNAISYIQDTKGGLVNVCQIMYLNEIKNSLKGVGSPISTPNKKQQQRS